METRTNLAGDNQREDRSSYRGQREADADGSRIQGAASDRGSLWERAAAAQALDRSRREHVSAYLDESSVVHVTRRSAYRESVRANVSDRVSERRARRGFTLVDDEPERQDQQQFGGSWTFSASDTFDEDLRAAEAVMTARRGRASTDAADIDYGAGDAEGVGYSAGVAADSGFGEGYSAAGGYHADESLSDAFDDGIRAAESVASRFWGRQSSDAQDEGHADESMPRRRTSDEAVNGNQHTRAEGVPASQPSSAATNRERVSDDAGEGYGSRSSYDEAHADETSSSSRWGRVSDDAHDDDESSVDESALLGDTPVDAASRDHDGQRAARDRVDPENDVHGIWALVDAICFVPETIGNFVLGTAERLHVRGLVAIIVAILISVTLYSPVRDLYLAHRRLDTLQKTYEIISAQNKQLEHEIEVLQTREGIENEARARGYVEPGEVKVVVKGLTSEDGAGSSTYTIADTTIPDDRPWYIKVLDDLFGYDPEA